MRRITISLPARSDDANTVARALEQVKHWRRSAELLRWAAAYLNGETPVGKSATPELDTAEIDAAMDDW